MDTTESCSPAALPAPPAPPAPSPARSWRLLDVDGDAVARRAVIGALTQVGFAVECLTDARTAMALAAWQPAPAGVAILASRLSGASSLELARVMRLTGFVGRILIVSAQMPAAEQARCAGFGDTVVLTKPLHVPALLEALDGPPSPAAGAPGPAKSAPSVPHLSRP